MSKNWLRVSIGFIGEPSELVGGRSGEGRRTTAGRVLGRRGGTRGETRRTTAGRVRRVPPRVPRSPRVVDQLGKGPGRFPRLRRLGTRPRWGGSCRCRCPIGASWRGG